MCPQKRAGEMGQWVGVPGAKLGITQKSMVEGENQLTEDCTVTPSPTHKV